jgi:hypothetical protein
MKSVDGSSVVPSPMEDAIPRFDYSGLRAVEETHRLIDPSVITEPIIEAYSDSLESRILALPVNTPSAQRHAFLAEEKLPVFSALYTPDMLLLLVPEGTKLVASMIPALVRNLRGSQAFFFEVGLVLGGLEKGGMRLTDSYLNSLAFSIDEKAPNGGRIYLVPPYHFEEGQESEVGLEQLRTELELEHGITRDRTEELIQALEAGWDAAI